MINNLTPLTLLTVNKSTVFYSPLENKDVLVRTGTIKDNLSLFHSISHAYSKDYISMDNTERINYVNKLNKKNWENLSITTIQFQKNVNTILSDFYKFIKNNDENTESVEKIINNIVNKSNTKNDIEIYNLITEIMPINKNPYTNIINCDENNNINECKKKIIKLTLDLYIKKFNKLITKDGVFLEKNKISLYIKKFEKLITEIVNEAENYTYTKYINEQPDTQTIQFISDKINRDIYFIDSTTRMPFNNHTNKKDLQKRKSIIVIHINENHYEIVGRLMPGNKIQREFDHTDSLIKQLYTYLCHPEKIINEYPNLVPFLTKNIKKIIGVGSPSIKKSNKSDSYNYEKSSNSNSDKKSSSPSYGNKSPSTSHGNKSPSSDEIFCPQPCTNNIKSSSYEDSSDFSD